MSSTEAILERHEVRIDDIKERQDRMDAVIQKFLFLLLSNLIGTVGALALLLLKGK